MLNLKKSLKILLVIAAVLSIIYMVSIFVWAGSYATLAEDDFSHGTSYGLFLKYVFLPPIAAVIFMLSIFISWQGTFYSMFLQGLLSPVCGLMLPQLRIEIILNILLIAISVAVLIWEIFKRLPKDNSYLIPLITGLVIFSMWGFFVYDEALFWFSGATSYGFPFSLMLFALTATLHYYRTKSLKSAKWAKIMGFLTSGGTLMIAGASCYFNLLCMMYYYYKEGHIDKTGRKIFKWCFIGALINALAPGNYFRKYFSTGGGLGIPAACKYTVITSLKLYISILKNSCFFEIAFVCLIIGIVLGLNLRKNNYMWNQKLLILAAFLSVLASPIATFPAVLGYASKGGQLGARCNFVINTTFIFAVVFIAIVIGATLSYNYKKISLAIIPLAIIAMILWANLVPYSLSDNKYFELQTQLENGELQYYYNECKAFLDRLDAAEDGSDVRITSDELPQKINNTVLFYNTEEPANPDNWLNKAFATYYKLNSFAVE